MKLKRLQWFPTAAIFMSKWVNHTKNQAIQFIYDKVMRAAWKTMEKLMEEQDKNEAEGTHTSSSF